MARDPDGNYYYDAGTVNEQFDDIDIYEDPDGNLGIAVSGDEMRVHEFAHAFAGRRGPPSTDELADGEHMMYVSNGDGANSSDGDFVIARNDDEAIEEAVVSLTYESV